MSKRKPASFTPYFTQKDADQVRAALLAAGQAEGYRSVTDLIEAAVLREVKRLQRRHNQGKAWEPVPAGALRPGRRTLNEEKHRR
ncbi:ParB family protein [Arthrobacter monumenti]